MLVSLMTKDSRSLNGLDHHSWMISVDVGEYSRKYLPKKPSDLCPSDSSSQAPGSQIPIIKPKEIKGRLQKALSWVHQYEDVDDFPGEGRLWTWFQSFFDEVLRAEAWIHSDARQMGLSYVVMLKMKATSFGDCFYGQPKSSILNANLGTIQANVTLSTSCPRFETNKYIQRIFEASFYRLEQAAELLARLSLQETYYSVFEGWERRPWTRAYADRICRNWQ